MKFHLFQYYPQVAFKMLSCFRNDNAEKKSLDEITCVENLSDGEAEDEGNSQEGTIIIKHKKIFSIPIIKKIFNIHFIDDSQSNN